MAIEFKSDKQKSEEVKKLKEKDVKENKEVKTDEEYLKKAKIKKKRTKREKLAIFSLVMSIIVTVLVIGYVALPAITFILGIFGYIIYGLIIVVITICTLGLLWISEGFRNWQANFAASINNFMFSGNKIANSLTPAFGYVAGFGGALVIFNLIFAIYIKKHPNENESGNKGRLIAAIIITVVYITFTVIDSVLIAHRSAN